MFPIFKADLPLSHISDYWSRDIKPPASSSELLDLLIRAWWRGELFLGDAHSRFEFLKKMFAIMSKNEHSGIVFTLGEEIRATTLKDLPNGDVEIYSRPCIPVPSWDTETWNEAACDPAFQRLSSELVSCVRDYHVWLPVFAGFVLSREERLCAANLLERQRSWRRDAEPSDPCC
jgi:hypothetical protein